MILPAPSGHQLLAAKGPILRDIHLPPEPSWWPPAPGWWLLAGVLLLALLAAAWRWWRYRRLAMRRQRVLAEVDRLATQYRLDGDKRLLAGGLHQLLRRVARQQDASAAQHSGSVWRRILARVPVDAPILDRLLLLEQAIYRPSPEFDEEAAMTAVRQWLRLALRSKAWRQLPPEHADV